MTKAELIEKMANDAGISKVAAGAALNSIINNIGTSLKKRWQSHIARIWNFQKSSPESTQRTQSSNWRSNQNQSLQCCKIQCRQKAESCSWW